MPELLAHGMYTDCSVLPPLPAPLDQNIVCSRILAGGTGNQNKPSSSQRRFNSTLSCAFDTANGPAISDGLMAEPEPGKSTGRLAHLSPPPSFLISKRRIKESLRGLLSGG
ncbi:uncharacterized protein APUU_21026S [Aspergillus puulaauensis]|uniref:Uncharacterized protein n=1 Tax=Aspergillus puulaauensis TaxID=1220207 RepID=A0A7R7XH83_9EURO|nr:uncharacterized protein APUU_21026S [Aspergillus puulaauensis]BCS20594.1 hypothetical protein APUU_21026S [Aspergillus puulaauensis]